MGDLFIIIFPADWKAAMFGVCVRRGSVRAAARVVYRPGVRAATGGNSGAAGATAPWRRAGAALGAVGLAGGVAAMVGWQQNQETPAPLGMHLRPTVAECEESPAKIHRVRDAVPDVGVVIEPGTGLPFAEQVYESGSTQRLVGLGCR